MKVLLVSVFPPIPAPEANHALHLTEQLAAAGAEVHVLCQVGSISASHDHVIVHPIATDWSWSDLPRIIRCIRECKPDVVYLLYLGWIYNYRPMITFLPTLCRRMFKGLPCVTQFEATEASVPGRSLPERMLRNGIASLSRGSVHSFLGTLLSDSARVIALSSPHRDRLVDVYPPVGDKIAILPPPPLIRRSLEEPSITRRRIREQWGVTDDDYVLMYWGYIYPGKGVETLLRAFHTVCRDVPNARLALIGGYLDVPSGRIKSKDYYRMVRTLPQKLGISDRVIWTGSFDWDSEAGSQFLFAGDACVLPLDWGITLNNSSLAAATTHGLPVIGTEVPDRPDEVLEHGQNVYLCPPSNPAALTDAMMQLIKDKAFRERLRRGSCALAEKWHSWPIMNERLMEILAAAQAEGGKSGERPGKPSLPAADGGSAAASVAQQDQVIFYPTDPPTPRFGDSVLSCPAGRNGGAAPEGDGAPLVSVVVAVYNVEKYLSQCLDALVNQTLKNIEIIVVNDASTDNSQRIIDEYSARYASIRVVACTGNQGLATVRNIGMKHAKGAYVTFADGDDWVDIRMCEVMYRRAIADDADVLSASATVYYDDKRNFVPLFDQYVRENLDPEVKAHAFDLLDEPRALSLEVVAWTKLYKRSFLLAHDLRFEDGLNSYEDICFHVFCMVKAERISVIDDPLIYYRQNRPGQISGRTNRKVFEAFEVFRRIHDKLLRWDVPNEIWEQVIRLELRQYDWLLSDRVRSSDKAEFIAAAADQLRRVPESAWQGVRDAGVRETAKRLCMRRGWLRGYRLATGRSSLPSLLMCLLSREVRRSHAGGYRYALRNVAREPRALLRSAGGRVLATVGMKDRFKSAFVRVGASSGWQAPAVQTGTPMIHVCQIKDQVLLIRDRSGQFGFKDAVWRTEYDYYLSQTAVLREGDTVLDVGAHVGVWSIHLAKKFPFIKVYALEPDPENYACLLENIALNQVKNVVPLRMALAGKDGLRTLYSDPLGDRWVTIHSGFAAKQKVLSVSEVETTTIKRLCKDYGIMHCRMLKISAWGAVKEVLQSLPGSVAVDYLCGEVDLEDCGKATLEAASWRSARHFFWRTIADTREGRVWSCVQHLPQALEPDALVPDPVPARDPTGDPALIGRTQIARRRDGRQDTNAQAFVGVP